MHSAKRQMYGKNQFSVQKIWRPCHTKFRFFLNNSWTPWPIFIKLFFPNSGRRPSSNPSGKILKFEKNFWLNFWRARFFKCMEKWNFQYKFVHGRVAKNLENFQNDNSCVSLSKWLARIGITFDWIVRFGWFFRLVIAYGILQRLVVVSRGAWGDGVMIFWI